MKKILVALLVLALVAPAMADVAVTATNEGSGQLKIKISPTAGAIVRGVALKLSNSNGAVIDATTDVTVSGAKPFNTFVDYAFDNAGYTIGAGHPIADPAGAGVATLPAGTFVLSAGYLDEGGNQGGVDVDSFFDVFFTLSGDATINMELDTLRGGIVGDNLGAVTVQASQLLPDVTDWISGPAVVTKTTAGTGVSPLFVNSGRVETFTVSGVTGSSAIEYQFTWGDATQSAWSTSTTATKTYTYGGAGVSMPAGYSYNVTVQARLVSNTAMSVTSSPLALTSEAVKSTATFYATWADFARPNCWAYQRNCRGDTNNSRTGVTPSTYVWVNAADLTVLSGGYGKVVADLKLVPNGICADFNRARTGVTPATYVWVNAADLTVLSGYYGKTVGSVPVCDQTNYHYWTN